MGVLRGVKVGEVLVVTWRDTFSNDSDWRSPRKARRRNRVSVMETTGIVLKRGKRNLQLVDSWSKDGKVVAGGSTIPISCITRVKRCGRTTRGK